MQAETLADKQQFLRTQIIGKEFDADEFMEFMGRIKNEGQNIDLDNWSMKELRGVVEKYKEHLNKGKQELMNSRMSRDIRQTKIFEPAKKEKVKYEGTQLWDFQLDCQQECSKSQLVFQFPANTTPKIQIEKFQLKSVGGFLFGIGSRNELELTISSNFTSARVVRKVEDCDWLKNILTMRHPGCFVPALEPSREFATDDKKGIAARVNEVSQFLNSLLDYPCFHYSLYFREFLTQANYKRFTQYKNRESAFAVEKDFLQIQTPKGSFHLNLTDKLNQSLKRASQVSQDLNTLYGQLGGSISRVIGDMDQLGKSMKVLNDVTSRIGEKLNQIQAHFKYEQIQLPTILLSINNSGAIIYKNLRLHTKAIIDLNDSFLKPAVRQWNQFITFDRRHTAQTKNYLSAKENLLRRKERHANDPLRWELPEVELQKIQRQGIAKLNKEEIYDKMFPSDNDKEHRTRIWLSYVHQNYLTSFRQFLVTQEKTLLNSYLAYTEKYLATTEEISNSFVGFKEMFAS